MRPEPRRWNRTIRTVMSLVVVGSVVLIIESFGPSLRAQAPTCSTGTQEAEFGVLTGFEVGSDPAAAGGAYIHVPNGQANRWTPSEAYRASYCLTVDEAGRYRVAATAWADNGTNDSFFVAIDGEMVDAGRWDVAQSTGYGRDHVNSYQAADPVEVDLTAGDHYVDVYLREDGTRLDTIAFERLDVDPACKSGWVEADKAHLEGFAIVADAAAKGKKAIEVPEGTGSSWYPSASHRAVFCLNAPRDGVFRIEADVLAPSTTSDSFFVRVDDGDTYPWYPPVAADYVRDLVNAHAVADPVELWLTKGPHIVEVFLREDGTRLDRIRLEEKPEPPGGECKRLRYEAEDVDQAGFEVGFDPAASGGAYLSVPDGNGSAWSPSDAVYASFCVDIKRPGLYQINAGVWADSGTNDSFWVKVDGGTARRWDVAWFTDYRTDVVGFAGSDPLVVDLSKGDHVIEILLREDGTRLDWLGVEQLPDK